METDGGPDDGDDGAAAAQARVRRAALQAAIDNDPLLSLRDSQECTPLHVAIANGGAAGGKQGGGGGGKQGGEGGGGGQGPAAAGAMGPPLPRLVLCG
jgi:hypothetical protein